jgi:hypothetical protein
VCIEVWLATEGAVERFLSAEAAARMLSFKNKMKKK